MLTEVEESAIREAAKVIENARLLEVARITKQVEAVHDRVFNGLGKELREEIHKEIGKVTKILIAILTGLILLLGGVIVEGRFSSTRSTEESQRNYKALMDIGNRLQLHILGFDKVEDR